VRSNPFLNRDKTNDGRKSEKRQARELKARLQPASGALPGAKGDMKTEASLIEYKSTEKESLSLKHEWLTKISGEALHINMTPILIMAFVHPNGTPKDHGQWAVIPLWLAQERGVL
jgi:hypothetical protein